MPSQTIEKALSGAEHPILLESGAQLARAAENWSRRDLLGIDTEFVRERTYRADLGLVQISDGETAWLADPLAIEDLQPLRNMLTDPDVLKILHSGSEDLEVMDHALQAIPDPLVDSQVAFAMQGQPLQLGYHAAVKLLFEIEIDKGQTRSNWCRRPLTAQQLHYAAMDVVLLPEMVRRLRPELKAGGRWDWLLEDIRRMQDNATRPADADHYYLRFSGAPRMDEGTLRALKYLARWREGVAMERNRARGFVIPDAALMQIARRRPASRRELESIEGIHPVALSRYGRTLLDLVEKAAADTAPIKRITPLTDRQNRQLKQMRQVVLEKAKDLSVDAALLASRRELEKLIRSTEAGEEPPERFRGWRRAEVTEALLEVLRAKG
jgi:ribonuclease D